VNAVGNYKLEPRVYSYVLRNSCVCVCTFVDVHVILCFHRRDSVTIISRICSLFSVFVGSNVFAHYQRGKRNDAECREVRKSLNSHQLLDLTNNIHVLIRKH